MVSSRRSLLLRLMIGTATVIVGVSAYWSYQTVRSLILENLKENALLEVQQGVNEIDQWLMARKAEVETIANTPTLQTMNWSEVGPYLKTEIERSADFFIFAMVEPDGSFYNTKVGRSTKNASHRKYFQYAMAGQTAVSDPFIGLETGIPTIAIAAPIWPSSGPAFPPVGDVNGNMKLDRVTEVVNQLHYGEGSYAFALNSQGGAITHPNSSLMFNVDRPTSPILLAHDNETLATIAQQMVNGKQGIELHAIDEHLQYVAYLPLQEADWSVALVIPYGNIERQLLPLDLMALVLMGLTLSMIIVLWQVQSFEQKQLKRTKAAAESANRAKSEFLANMSHELRTPLNSILGYTQILRREQTITPKQKKGLNIIHQNGEHLLTLINDVLDIAKIEARKLDIYPQLVHFPTLLQGVIEIIDIRAAQKGLEFYYLPGGNLPQNIYIDEKRLRQVLINLLGNAVKFTEQGSVTLKINAIPQVSDLSFQESFKLCFEVEDTGIGIATEAITKIFQPFEQVNSSRCETDGTGLGLAISQQIINLMGSQIQVQSRLGEGSTFSFALELELPILEHWKPSLSFPHGQSIIGYQGNPRTILVVDDRWENRSVLVNLLEPLGFTLIEAENGQEGLTKALAHQPDLVITDLVMPMMDGYQLLQKLRHGATHKQIAIIVSSASVSVDDRQASLKAGAHDFLPKPIAEDELFSILAKHLEIEWVYEQTNCLNLADNSAYTSSSDIIIPPTHEMRTLHHAAKMGDILQIEREAHRIKQLGEDYDLFAKQLLQLVQTMDDEAILTLVEQSMAKLA